MPNSTSPTNMSLGLRSSAESSSYDSCRCSDETGISLYQKCSEEAGVAYYYKQFLEDIPEDGSDDADINIWIKRSDSRMLQLFGIQLVSMIDQSIQEINSKHGQAQASDMHRLLKLAGVMIMLPPSPDLLPGILRLYVTLETLPINLVNGITNELMKCVRKNLHWFRSLARKVSYNEAQGGGIHRVTSYVMNYVRILWEHDGALNIILVQDDGESEINPLQDEKWTRVDSFVLHLIGLLDTLLERIAKRELMGLEFISLLNNAHFILDQLQKLEMKSALQQNWILKYNTQVENQITRYLDLSWHPVCSCLDAHTRMQVLFPCFHPHPLTRFYTMLESTCAEQQNWKIEDPKLRQEVRKAVSSRVIQCYQAYLQKKGVKLLKHTWYTPQDIENKLMELFEG